MHSTPLVIFFTLMQFFYLFIHARAVILLTVYLIDKTIKLWKVFEKKVKQVMSTNVANGAPTVSKTTPIVHSVKVSVLIASIALLFSTNAVLVPPHTNP